MSISTVFAASVAGALLFVSAQAADISATEARARDFSFQGVRFGCSIEQFKQIHPNAVRVPDPTGEWKSVMKTRPDEKLDAVLYKVKREERDSEGRPKFQFRSIEYLFVDGAMVEFYGIDYMADFEASKRYLKLIHETLGEPAEEHYYAEAGSELEWHFPKVDREFMFRQVFLGNTAGYVGRDTAAIRELERKRAER
ncbi:MAG: hypothetical protein ACKOSQ_00815 [Planctomycetaceae bacterium]